MKSKTLSPDGCKVTFVVTAGPTREYLDPVRFLSNPSTGRMGFAVARVARALGYDVTLIAGPVALKAPPGVEMVPVTSARDMLSAVEAAIDKAPGIVVLVMSAAVADWRPKACAAKKLKKSEMSSTLELVRNADILKTLKERYPAKTTPGLIRIGFAAETGNPIQEGVRKCREKALDMVVANDVTLPGAGFGTDTNRVSFIFPCGRTEALALMSKTAVARRIVKKAQEFVSAL